MTVGDRNVGWGKIPSTHPLHTHKREPPTHFLGGYRQPSRPICRKQTLAHFRRAFQKEDTERTREQTFALSRTPPKREEIATSSFPHLGLTDKLTSELGEKPVRGCRKQAYFPNTREMNRFFQWKYENRHTLPSKEMAPKSFFTPKNRVLSHTFKEWAEWHLLQPASKITFLILGVA